MLFIYIYIQNVINSIQSFNLKTQILTFAHILNKKIISSGTCSSSVPHKRKKNNEMNISQNIHKI